MPVQFTTDLPDEDQPVLGNGVEDEVHVDRETAVTNYGDVRVQIRETGESSWDSNAVGFGEFIGSYDTLTVEFVDREDGEAYEVRARTETEHRTGAWTDPVSIVTTFPGASNLAVDGTTATSIDVSWIDNADNEDGFKILGRQSLDDGSWSDWRVLDDTAPNTTARTVEWREFGPDQTWELLVRAYTEHTSADSGTATATTTSLDKPVGRTRTSDWQVEIEHASGAVHRPSILDGVQINPKVNERPEIRIPVPKADKWQDPGFEDAPVKVWHRGDRQPIDRLEDVETETADGSKRSVLVCRGGTALADTRIEQQWRVRKAHEAARDVIDQLPYNANVDAPPATVEEDVQLASITSQSDHEERIEPGLSTLPATVTIDGDLDTQQSCFFSEGEVPDSDFNTTQTDVGGLSAGFALLLQDTGAWAEWTFTPAYRIPEQYVGVAVRDSSDNFPALSWYLNGQEIDNLGGGSTLTLSWTDVGDGEYSSTDGWTGGDLAADQQHTIRVEIDSAGTDEHYRVDCLALYDQRYSYNFANETDTNDALAGPQLYPDALPVQYDEIATPASVTAGRAEAALDDTSNGQALRLSNDQGRSFESASNTQTIDVDFVDPDLGPSLTFEAVLSRHGTQTDTPTQGVKGQTLSSVDLYADLDDTPLVIKRSVDGNAGEVLRSISETANAIWEFRRDGATQSIEWTTPGQRVSNETPALSRYDTKKTTAEIVEKATVRGAGRDATETVTSQSDAWVDLPDSPLVDGSEVVRDAATGQRYLAGRDYEIDYLDGRLQALGSGAIDDGQSIKVSYRWRVSGSYTADGVPDPRLRVVNLPQLTTARACRLAAKQLVDEAQDPAYEATIAIPTDESGWSVVDAINPPEVPTGEQALHIRGVQNSPQETVLRLGNRRTVGEFVGQLRERQSTLTQQI
ncbi:hypothetical protein BRC81_02935 [Halobacteriales archaeon QS_1_68_20]|nr:MAG: hypothetical protein BRC81_02935 [Halobacteriales archaeon QS_1_68_20]